MTSRRNYVGRHPKGKKISPNEMVEIAAATKEAPLTKERMLQPC